MFLEVKLSYIRPHVLVCFIVILADFTSVLSSLENNTTQVACLGDSVSFDCCVMNGIITVWQGTAFTHGLSCDSDNILLRHTIFNISDYNISYSCLNGAIVAKTLSVEEDLYCSQLNFTVSSTSNLEAVLSVTVQCIHDDGIKEQGVASFSIMIFDENTFMCSGSTSQKDIHQSESNEKG